MVITKLVKKSFPSDAVEPNEKDSTKAFFRTIAYNAHMYETIIIEYPAEITPFSMSHRSGDFASPQSSQK